MPGAPAIAAGPTGKTHRGPSGAEYGCEQGEQMLLLLPQLWPAAPLFGPKPANPSRRAPASGSHCSNQPLRPAAGFAYGSLEGQLPVWQASDRKSLSGFRRRPCQRFAPQLGSWRSRGINCCAVVSWPLQPNAERSGGEVTGGGRQSFLPSRSSGPSSRSNRLWRPWLKRTKGLL